MIFIELCAGTAAMSFALCGVKPPVPMIGSKRTLAPAIIDALKLTKPSKIILNEPGEWGRTHETLFIGEGSATTTIGRGGWHRVAGWFEAWLPRNDRELFDELRKAPPPDDPFERAAVHLYLQTRTYRGKEVYPDGDGGWVTHGFDPEYRAAVTPGSKDRGWFNGREQLASKLRMLSTVNWPEVVIHGEDAVVLSPMIVCTEDPSDVVVFIDPPYAEREQYAHILSRAAVLDIARRWQRAGCRVVICEGEPLAGLERNWRSLAIPTRRGGTQLSKPGHEEWLTWNWGVDRLEVG